jgi:hypothetical protein
VGQVLTIFEYAANTETELSFPANVLVTLVTPDVDGWCEGMYDGKTGLFPASYIDESFVKFPPSVFV